MTDTASTDMNDVDEVSVALEGRDTEIPSQHVQQMRRMVDHLRRGMERLNTESPPPLSSLFDDNVNDDGPTPRQLLIRSARTASQNYRQEREAGVKNVLKRLKTTTKTNTNPMDTVCMQSDGISWEIAKVVVGSLHSSNSSTIINSERRYNDNESASDWSSGKTFRFKQQYINRNVPCVIRGLDKTQFFSHVTSQWCTLDNDTSSITNGTKTLQGNEKTQKINTEWFRHFIGNETMVPVRYTDCDDYSTSTTVHEQGLDDEGRAKECNTRQMSLDEWISICQNQQNGATPTKNERGTRVDWYLKDWHLLQFLAHQDCSSSTPESPPSLPLYTTPSIFERDILNRFLERCCDDGEKRGGDYKFVYWGPAGSRTSLHSDVLHSFSWSYNVIGMKKWIFHVPSISSRKLDDDHEEMERHWFEVIQHAGETIFVPSTWKHEVVNLVETLSINHNWITPANIDQAWICLQTEIASIEEEVQSWGVIPSDDFEARENMLRGCIGLDTTMFTLMVLLEIIELIPYLNLLVGDNDSDDELWYCMYNILRLGEVLVDVLRQEDLVQRMTAGFCSVTYALEVKNIANVVIQLITIMNNFSD